MEPTEKKSYEASLTRLKEIEHEISAGSLSLEDCMERLDEGVDLAKDCLEAIKENLNEENVLATEPGSADAS